MLVAVQFEKQIEQTINDLIYSLRPDFKLFCSGSLEVIAETLMEKCSSCNKKITSIDTKNNERMYTLFILNKKNDRLMLSLLEVCLVNVKTYHNICQFFDSSNVQCRSCQTNHSRKRPVSVEKAAVTTSVPILSNEVKEEKEDQLVEARIIRKDVNNSNSPTVKKAKIEASEPEEVRQEQLKETIEVEIGVSSDTVPLIMGASDNESPGVILEKNKVFEEQQNVNENEDNENSNPYSHDFNKETTSNSLVIDSKRKIRPECSQCGKSFTTKHSLKQHLILHTGLKPYECDVCNTKFSQKTHLTEHSRTHTGIKPHECNICGRTFTTSSGMKSHRREHLDEPFECKECSYKTTFSCNLKRHMSSVHRDEKPLECKECSYKTGVSCHLKRHIIRVHRGEKTFECDICEKKYVAKVDLIKHKLNHHGQNK